MFINYNVQTELILFNDEYTLSQKLGLISDSLWVALNHYSVFSWTLKKEFSIIFMLYNDIMTYTGYTEAQKLATYRWREKNKDTYRELVKKSSKTFYQKHRNRLNEKGRQYYHFKKECKRLNSLFFCLDIDVDAAQ